MAGIGRELALAREGGLQPIEHTIEGRAQPAQLIAALQVEAPAQVGLADLLGRAGDRLDRAQGTRGQPVAASRTQRHDERGDGL